MIISLLSFSSNSAFSKNEVWPFTKTIDFGMSVSELVIQLDINQIHIDSNCNKTFVTYNTKSSTPVTIVYYFNNDTIISNKTKIFGLYQVDVIYSNNLDLTSDDNVVEFHVRDFVNLFGVKYFEKNGNLVSNYNLMNDQANPSGGIFLVDGIWFVFGKNGNVVILNFPTREHIRMGQKSRITYKQKYSINWKCK